jgi:hypothetical protein
MKPTHGNYRISEVDGYTTLRNCIHAIYRMRTEKRQIEALADLLMRGHAGTSGYMTFGNNKLLKHWHH